MNRTVFLKTSSLAILAIVFHPLKNYGKETFENVTFYNSKDEHYNIYRLGFNKRFNKKPNIIAVCKNTKGVQEAVLLANRLRLAIAIKSGGHCMEGLNNNEDGMQIVLSDMNDIIWLDHFTIKVGPGSTLKSIYEELIPKNKILQGGSCAGVGIGGLTLGGGYGLMSRLFGLTCDSLLQITMVDGKGNIVNTTNDTELLWACKGGGNGNFGVITEMTFQVHNRPKQMSSYKFRSFNITTSEGKSILKTWFEACTLLPNSCFSTCLFNGDTAYILLTNVSKQTTNILKFINKIKTVTQKHTQAVGQELGKALENYYGQQEPILFKNASSGLYKSFTDIEAIVEDLLKIVFETKGMIYQINTLGGAIQKKNHEQTSSFAHREYLFFSELQSYWDAENQGAVKMKQFELIQQLIEKQGITAQYRNYPDLNFKNFENKYYGKNLQRLKAIKLKYDPDDNIRHEQSIQL